MRKIIVTGSTGFVGKFLIKKIVKKFGAKNITCLCYNKDSQMEIDGRKLLDSLSVKYQLVDLTNFKSLINIQKNPDIVIHLAAETDTSKKDHKVNDKGVINLYNALGKLKRTTHFIHIGTMVEVVGRPNCNEPIDEQSKDYPTNEYTRTKLLGESFLLNKSKKDKFRLTIIRPNTIYGKGVRKNSLFDMVTNMVKNGSVVTRINWPGRSGLIHVEDLTDTIMFFTDHPPKSGKPEKYLVNAENLSIFDLSKVIHKKLKINLEPITIPDFVWKIIKPARKLSPIFENLLPYTLYNYLWRFGIIIDDVVWCETSKINKRYKNFNPKLFEHTVGDVL